MYENGAIYKTPDGKTIILLFLHGDVFCLLEIANGKANVVRAEKWEYSRSELPRRLEGFEFVEGSHLSVETTVKIKAPVQVAPKATPKVTQKESKKK
jgi:hypothetical protein